MKRNLLFVLIVFTAFRAAGQWTNDTTLNTTVRDTLGATAPMMASAYNGYTYITWFEYDAVNNFNLRMQLLDTGGYKMWGPEGIVVSNFPQNSAIFRYDLKTDLDGNAIVAFQDERSGHLDVVVYKFDLLGTPMWGINGIQLTDSLSTEGISPVIGTTRNNNVYIAWTATAPSRKWIACQYISVSGTPQWNTLYRVIDTVTNTKFSRPKLISMDGDNIQMVYVQETGNFPALTSTIYAQHISNAGNNIWPSPVIVSANTIPFFFFPEPVSDGNDGFFVAFDSSNPINPALIDVFVQHVDSSGILWSPGGTEAIVSNTDNLITGASCFVDSRKEFWVVLRQQDGGQSIAGVTLQKFDSTGAAAFGNTGRVIINATGDLYDPRTINDAFDGIIFSTFYGPFGGMHIMAMKVDFGASLMWSGLPVPIASQNSNKDDLASGKFINNNLVFAWQDDRNGSGIFAQNVRGDGSTGLINGIQTPSLYTVSLCPNPSSGPDLLLPGGSCTLTVTDPLGKMILNEKTDSQKYSFHTLSSLPTGLYTIRVMLENSTHIVRWVKSN